MEATPGVDKGSAGPNADRHIASSGSISGDILRCGRTTREASYLCYLASMLHFSKSRSPRSGTNGNLAPYAGARAARRPNRTGERPHTWHQRNIDLENLYRHHKAPGILWKFFAMLTSRRDPTSEVDPSGIDRCHETFRKENRMYRSQLFETWCDQESN